MVMMKHTNGTTDKRILDAPIQLSEMAANMDLEDEKHKSVWIKERDDTLVSN